MPRKRTGTIRGYIKILPPTERLIVIHRLNGIPIEKTMKKTGFTKTRVNEYYSNAIERMERFCYNREKYIEIFKDVFAEYKRNLRRKKPLKKFPNPWGLIVREINLLYLLKVSGMGYKEILKRSGVSPETFKVYKSVMEKKIDAKFIERDYNNTSNDDIIKPFDLELPTCSLTP